MRFTEFVKSCVKHILLKSQNLEFEPKVPSLISKLNDIDSVGLYLHIPFCRQICPYCPYNKAIYQEPLVASYVDAVIQEIAIYSEILGQKPVTSFYIGGGTPTTMLHTGIDRILEQIFSSFNMQCDIHMESHPNDLTDDNLDIIQALHVKHLSIGIEALQDRYLKMLHRPYSVKQVSLAVKRAVRRDFDCVNADFIFALPKQSFDEISEAGHSLVDFGVDQVAAYPLFTFPYTPWAEIRKRKHFRNTGLVKRRKMLSILEEIFYAAGFRRTSVWAFTKPEVPKYCSVTVPLYIGLGASGGSYLKDVLYFNTFDVEAYVQSLKRGRLPIALSLDLTPMMQRVGWLYWRFYETRFARKDFHTRFGEELDQFYGWALWLFSVLGMLKENGSQVVLTDRGTYWIHALQDLFSIDYISKLWPTLIFDPWPENVFL